MVRTGLALNLYTWRISRICKDLNPKRNWRIKSTHFRPQSVLFSKLLCGEWSTLTEKICVEHLCVCFVLFSACTVNRSPQCTNSGSDIQYLTDRNCSPFVEWNICNSKIFYIKLYRHFPFFLLNIYIYMHIVKESWSGYAKVRTHLFAYQSGLSLIN